MQLPFTAFTLGKRAVLALVLLIAAIVLTVLISGACSAPTASEVTVKAPAGKTVSWESVITDEEPGRSISWQARNADVPNSGKVEFEDAGERGTIVRAIIAYEPPAGVIGKVVAKMFQREPRIQSRRDLRRFKQLMETGEIATGARNQRERQAREEEQ